MLRGDDGLFAETLVFSGALTALLAFLPSVVLRVLELLVGPAALCSIIVLQRQNPRFLALGKSALIRHALEVTAEFRQGRHIAQAAQSEEFEKLLGGGVDQRPSGNVLTAHHLYEPSLDKRLEHPTTIDAAYRLYLRPGDGLPVGHDGDRLGSRSRETLRPFAKQLTHVTLMFGSRAQLPSAGDLDQANPAGKQFGRQIGQGRLHFLDRRAFDEFHDLVGRERISCGEQQGLNQWRKAV